MCARVVPLVMIAFNKLGPSAQGYLQSLADVACSIDVVYRGVRLRIAVSWLCVGSGQCTVLRHYYHRVAQSAGKNCRDGNLV